jgi:3-phosphoshikimate 1-carboxyvinyltransferase
MNRPLARATAPLRGGLTVPGDKSISHRVVLLSLLADGPCRATGWLDSADTRSSLEAVRALGAVAHLDGDELTITPPPARPAQDLTIDCGNSGTTARLLMGLLAGWLRAGDGAVTLTGDASLRGRPMGRVVEPLRRMGADLAWAGEQGLLPVVVRGALLHGCDHALPVASAQVKSALLLAGLGASGVTTVRGADGSRDHTELMLRGLGVPVTGTPDAPAVAGPCGLPPSPPRCRATLRRPRSSRWPPRRCRVPRSPCTGSRSTPRASARWPCWRAPGQGSRSMRPPA